MVLALVQLLLIIILLLLPAHRRCHLSSAVRQCAGKFQASVSKGRNCSGATNMAMQVISVCRVIPLPQVSDNTPESAIIEQMNQASHFIALPVAWLLHTFLTLFSRHMFFSKVSFTLCHSLHMSHLIFSPAAPWMKQAARFEGYVADDEEIMTWW